MPFSKRSIDLSEREREVLFLAADGLTDKEIAVRLAIREKTVRTYWDRIRAKLNASSRTQALAVALKRAHEELSAREEQLRTFVQSMPVAFFAFDENMTILASNAEGSELTGYEEDEMVGTRLVYGRVIPEQTRRTQMVREWLHRGGEFRNWEVPIVRKDGSLRVVSWSSNSRDHPVPGWRTWAVGFDITAFREAEDSLHAMIQAAPCGVWLVDSKFRTRFSNPNMAATLGVQPGELTSLLDFLSVEDRLMLDEHTRNEERSEWLLNLVNRNGEIVPATLRPIFDSQMRKQAYVLLTHKGTV